MIFLMNRNLLIIYSLSCAGVFCCTEPNILGAERAGVITQEFSSLITANPRPARKLVILLKRHPKASAFRLVWTFVGIEMHENVNVRYDRSHKVLYFDSLQVGWDDNDKEIRFRKSIRF